MLLLAALMSAAPALGQPESLAGKSVQMIIGFGPGGGYEPEDGEHLAALIAKIYATPKPIVDRITALIK